jgi:hypothetical protein
VGLTTPAVTKEFGLHAVMGFRHIPGTLEDNGLRCMKPCQMR